MPSVLRRVALVSLAILAVACGPAPSRPPAPTDSPAPSLAAGEVALPIDETPPLPSGEVGACAGIGIHAVLHGDAHDPRVAWLTDSSLGGRIDLTWPPGYRARFRPGLEVLNASDAVVLREGHLVSGGCTTIDPHVLHLEPPFY